MSSSTGISFSGLSSGIDTTSIISAYQAAEQVPITKLQSQQTDLSNKKTVYSQLSSLISTLATKASALNVANSFSTYAATSSASSVASVSLKSDNSATAGSYSLTVSQLAQAHKVSTTAQSDVTTALGYTGTFTINGESISVTASDTLTSIAKKVNSASTGVTASLINGGSGNSYLTFTSSATGIASKIQLADTSGSVLSSLGVISGSTSIRDTSVTNGAASVSFSSQTTALSSLMGTTLSAATVKVNGVDVAIDTSTDSLQSIASKINAANAGVTATVKSTTDDNDNTTYKLQIVGASGTPTFTDDQNVLQSIGVLQKGYGNELVKAQDAAFTLDGVSLTSSSNTVTSAIPGVNLTLLKATSTVDGTTTTASSTITVSSDTSAISAKVQAFADAYNSVIDYINQYSTMDTDTYETGILFGDSAAQQVENTLGSALFNNVSGLTGDYTNLTSLGFSLDSDSKITIDSSTLSDALAKNPTAVSNLFKAVGTSSTDGLTYVSSTTKTKSAGTGSYAVNITQVATLGAYTGEQAQTSASTSAETLTFSGSLLSSTSYKLTVPSGSSASDTVNLINNDATLKDLMTASLDSNGKLQITSKKYGKNGNFAVVSNQTASTSNSGLGVGSLGTSVTGVDVAGTINGEAATGSGQFLTGNTGDANTEGLQIQYTGTTTGAVGTMKFTKGVGSLYNDLANQFTDTTNGLLTASQNSLQDQYDYLGDEITDMQDLADKKIETLKEKYNAMEQAVAQWKSQGSQLTAMLG